jgi:hypothetical protein
MNTIDTRDLSEKRDLLKENIFSSLSKEMPELVKDLTDFDDIDFKDKRLSSFISRWEKELSEIKEIDKIEEVLGEEFYSGKTLVYGNDFVCYIEELLEKLGHIPENFSPYLREFIDWGGVADDLKSDYIEVEYQGRNYLVEVIK